MILFCSISCSDLNGSVEDDADGGGDSLKFNNVLSLSCKIIRFEAPRREREGRYKATMSQS
jgi:hypothetical protein